MFKEQIQKHISSVEDTLDTAFAFRLRSDVNAVGGALLEQELTKVLSDETYVCLTNRMVETLANAGQFFIFPDELSLSDVLKLTKDMDNDYYATDLFLFERPSDQTWKYVDSISLKTSFSAKDDTKVNLVNDANGEVVEALVNGDDIYLGQTLLILCNMKKGNFQIVWIDDTIQGLLDGAEYVEKDNGSLVFEGWAFSFLGEEDERTIIEVTNRAKRANTTSASSFNRGVKIRKDMISKFGDVFSQGEIENVVVTKRVVADLLSL